MYLLYCTRVRLRRNLKKLKLKLNRKSNVQKKVNYNENMLNFFINSNNTICSLKYISLKEDKNLKDMQSFFT